MKRVLLLITLIACAKGAAFEGLAPAVDTGGPKVVFDLSRRPLPEIPYPNDLATRPDPKSPTGLRVNATLVAPTQLERTVRARLDQLDGFGTFAPLSVAFEKSGNELPPDAQLDVLDLYMRQNNSDPTDDGVYLIDLTTGETVPLDFNGGRFPYTLNNPAQYFVNDLLTNTYNLLFPMGAPCANCFNPAAMHATVRQQADDLITFYEAATNTLVMRPIVPMKQERRYAVVLTNKIHGKDGRPISSPHAGINHAAQTAELRPLPALLPALGIGLSDVAYTWAFTTQSTTRELEQIRRGLNGSGPLQLLSLQYPVQQGSSGTNYGTLMTVLQERGAYDPANPSTSPSDYFLPVDDGSNSSLTALLNDPAVRTLLLKGIDSAQMAALLATYKYLDYVVSGTFISPSFLDTQNPGEPADQAFEIDFNSGAARTQNSVVPFILAVPKEQKQVGHLAPFPVVIAGHGYTSTRFEEVLGFAGTFAKFGLATIAIDAYGHGLGLDPAVEVAARAIAHNHGLDAFAAAVFRGRARDLDYDGVKDPGGDFWTADTFHTRDAVRQSIVDWMQLVRVLRSFDGTGKMVQGGQVLAAGDFNGDGIPDIGGPASFPFDVPPSANPITCSPSSIPPVLCPGGLQCSIPQGSSSGNCVIFKSNDVNPGGDTFVFGISLGGILTGILPAVEPAIVAAAPVSSAGGLADVGLRSTLDTVVQAIFLELFGPLVATCPFSPSGGPIDPQTKLPLGACDPNATDAKPMLVLVLQDLNHERDVPIAPLTLAPFDRVMVRNLSQTTATADCSGGAKIDGCSFGMADAQGRLRLPIAADWPSLRAARTPSTDPSLPETVKVEVLQPGDRLQILLLTSGQTLDTFQAHSRFYGVDYNPGDALVSPSRGYGTSRNTPEFRRLMQLSQTILEPGDPVTYAPHYFFDPLPQSTVLDPPAGPSNVLITVTSGDPGVPVNTGIALARAARLVEMSQTDPSYGIPIDQVLVRAGVVEGVPGTHRFDDPAGGVYAALPGHVRCDPPATCMGDVLIDPTGYSCDSSGGNCSDGLDAPRLTPPLRQQLVRTSVKRPCPLSVRSPIISGCWSTNTSACASSAPASGGAAAQSMPGMSALMIPYLNRTGQHGFFNPQPSKPFDMDQFMANVVGRYFECRGTELHFESCQTDLAKCSWIPQPPP
ncbi:MAG: hypothetical protein E6J78_04955 [Deltaproteobacteria bacterium]|nr:MAG: hypothetical protein E6J78_04955 [Deltaproteobacteria bacterium]